MKHMASADGVSVDHGNYRLRERADLFLYVKNIQAGNSVGSHVASVSFYVHVASRAESFVACPCQYDDVDVAAIAAVVECVT